VYEWQLIPLLEVDAHELTDLVGESPLRTDSQKPNPFAAGSLAVQEIIRYVRHCVLRAGVHVRNPRGHAMGKMPDSADEAPSLHLRGGSCQTPLGSICDSRSDS
jgi:hypothetical protein